MINEPASNPLFWFQQSVNCSYTFISNFVGKRRLFSFLERLREDKYFLRVFSDPSFAKSKLNFFSRAFLSLFYRSGGRNSNTLFDMDLDLGLGLDSPFVGIETSLKSNFLFFVGDLLGE